MEQVTVQEAASQTGIDASQISQWLFADVLTPWSKANGTGDRALLDNRNIKELLLISKLNQMGVRRSRIKEIVRAMSSSKLNWWNRNGWLMVTADDWLLTDNLAADMAREFIRDGDTVLVVRLR
jgi:hypothetical protein